MKFRFCFRRLISDSRFFKIMLPLLIGGWFGSVLPGETANPPFRLGINFPFRSPEAASLKTYLELLNASGAACMRQMTFADVHWNQIEPEDNDWRFSLADSSIDNPFGLQAVPTLYGISAGENDTTGLQKPWIACNRRHDSDCGWQAARDSSDSKDYVQTVVNRYQSQVIFWEISNEMSTKMHRPLGLPLDDFVEFMHLNFRWIKAANPDAQVLLPGLPGTCGMPMSNAVTWFRDFLAAGGEGSFEIFNYHDYNSWWTLPAHYDSLQAVLAEFGLESLPVWCTESSISSEPGSEITPGYSSPEAQAADVWRRPAVLFAKGLDVYFWQSLWSSGPASEWREFGIVDASGQKKQSFHAFHLLVEKIENFATARALSFGEVTEDNASGGNGVWVVQFEWSDGTRRWVAWSPDRRPYTLAALTASAVTVTTTVPATLSADGETATFDTRTAPVTAGSVRLNLSDVPVLVEEVGADVVRPNPAPAISFTLVQNFPNPFNPVTTIRLDLPVPGEVQVQIFNQHGQRVRTLVNREMVAGHHDLQWDGHNASGTLVASGVYLYQMTVSREGQLVFCETKRMLLQK